MLAAVEIAELKYRLASSSAYFAAELIREPEPYSSDGILFPALVHLVRIEEDALDLGLAAGATPSARTRNESW